MAVSIPTTEEMISQLIATPSVSCVLPELDMGNRSIIDLLATWSETIGFLLWYL